MGLREGDGREAKGGNEREGEGTVRTGRGEGTAVDWRKEVGGELAWILVEGGGEGRGVKVSEGMRRGGGKRRPEEGR